MKVLKVINNNVVTCLDGSGKEMVVMGRGLGFGAKAGSIIKSASVEKVFRMDSQEEFSRLKELFSRLPAELLEFCSQCIDYAGRILGRRLSESIYVTLTDHIQFALERRRQGMDLPNALDTEVRVFYPEEYAIGRYILSQIQWKLNCTLPEDEAASIALHLVNAEYDSSMSVTMRTARVLQPMMEIVEQWPGLQLCRDNLMFDELIVHLKFMAMEAFTSGGVVWTDIPLDEQVRHYIPVAFACAQHVAEYLRQEGGSPVPTAEIAYLAICIRRASKA